MLRAASAAAKTAVRVLPRGEAVVGQRAMSLPGMKGAHRHPRGALVDHSAPVSP